MPESEAIKAPRLILDKDNNVINLDTGTKAPGIRAFGARPAPFRAEERLGSRESPITAIQRWSRFRQSPAPKAE